MPVKVLLDRMIKKNNNKEGFVIIIQEKQY